MVIKLYETEKEPVLMTKQTYEDGDYLTPVAYMSDMVLISSLPNVGKTAFATMLAGALLSSEPTEINCNFYSPKNELKKRVVFIDVLNSFARAEKNYAEINQRVGDGFDEKELTYHSLINIEVCDRLELIRKELRENDVKALIIDGIDGLVSDVKSAGEANQLIAFLNKHANGASIFATIGRNVKIGLRNGARGELGKRLEKASSFLAEINRVRDLDKEDGVKTKGEDFWKLIFRFYDNPRDRDFDIGFYACIRTGELRFIERF